MRIIRRAVEALRYRGLDDASWDIRRRSSLDGCRCVAGCGLGRDYDRDLRAFQCLGYGFHPHGRSKDGGISQDGFRALCESARRICDGHARVRAVLQCRRGAGERRGDCCARGSGAEKLVERRFGSLSRRGSKGRIEKLRSRRLVWRNLRARRSLRNGGRFGAGRPCRWIFSK